MSSAIAVIKPDSGSHLPVKSGDCLPPDRRVRLRLGGMWVLRAMNDARSHCMNLTEAVITMDMDKAQYHREVQGVGHFSLLRLGMMPETFWRAFVHELAARFNWDVRVLQAVSREETPQEELERHTAAMTQSFMVFRKYARKGAGL